MIRGDVSVPSEGVVARIEEIKADAGRVRVPRGSDDVLQSVVQEGHAQLRHRGLPCRIQRVAVGGPEVPHRPAPNVHVKGTCPGPSESRGVSSRGAIAEMEMRERKPEVILHIVDERLDGSGSREQHPNEANRYD